MRKSLLTGILVFVFAAFADNAKAGDARVVPNDGFTDTPMQPDGKWHVHDSKRPQPRVVEPGTFSSQEQPGRPPADADVLFDGTNLNKWKTDKGMQPLWSIERGAAVVKAGSGNISTRDSYGNFQLHIEWSAPTASKSKGQARGNSGVILHGRFEIQVGDGFKNPTYADGTVGAVYGQFPPLVNSSVKPGEWQVYDILFTAPKFKDGKVETPAYVTVMLNGVAVQNHTEIIGQTAYKEVATYNSYGGTGPIVLQDHGEAVRYRNIWIRRLGAHDE